MARWLVIVGISVLIAACGSTARSSHRVTASHLRTAPTPLRIPAPPPTGIPADPAAVAVIRAWSDALRHGQVAAAARYFAVPSVMINGTDAQGRAVVFRIHTAGEALFANETLPCGARLLSTDMRGQYVNALFALTGRPGVGGSNCGGIPRQMARTNFVIAHGRILAWIRAPSDPGDNGSGVPAGPAA